MIHNIKTKSLKNLQSGTSDMSDSLGKTIPVYVLLLLCSLSETLRSQIADMTKENLSLLLILTISSHQKCAWKNRFCVVQLSAACHLNPAKTLV